jgi:hypothetical protein
MLLLAALLAATVPAAEQRAIFKAAGFSRHGASWKSGNCKGLESASYSPGIVDRYSDLNGDGRPEAIVVEGGAICYGVIGQHFWLLSKQPNGNWKLLFEQQRLSGIRATKGVGGWPDLELGGRGTCYPIWRWNGKVYALNRFEYEGKPCKRP